jgi:hypothetical protein
MAFPANELHFSWGGHEGMEAGHGGWQRACQAICLSGETLPGDEKYFRRGLQKT